jgi:hypothetical protein
MRAQVELIEKMLLDEGHQDWNISKPLSYKQICYLAYLMVGIKIERHTLQKHFTICMGRSDLKSQVYYHTGMKAWVNSQGAIIPKEDVKKYRRTRAQGSMIRQDPKQSDSTVENQQS